MPSGVCRAHWNSLAPGKRRIRQSCLSLTSAAPSAGYINWCGAQKAGAIGDLPDFEGGIVQQAKVEGDVDAFGDDIYRAVTEAEADVDLGVLVFEQGHMRGDEASAYAKGGCDEYSTARVLGYIHHSGFGGIYRVEDSAGTV